MTDSKAFGIDHQTGGPPCKRFHAKAILTNEDGSERSVGGITLTNWGLILVCLGALYLFLGLYFGALITLAIEVRQEAWLKPSDDYFGPFEQVNRNLYNAFTGESVEALPASEDLTIDEPDPINWNFNRPDGCTFTTFTVDSDTVAVLVCDPSGKTTDNLWRVNPWIIDLATSDRMLLPNGCGLTDQNTTILESNGLYSGNNTCINGIITEHVNFTIPN